jgi:hypothetical protein
LLDENLVELFNTTADDGSVEEVCDPTKILSTQSWYSLDPQENWVSMTMQFWSYYIIFVVVCGRKEEELLE